MAKQGLRNPLHQAADDIQSQTYQLPQFQRPATGGLGGQSSNTRTGGSNQDYDFSSAEGLLPPPDMEPLFTTAAESHGAPINVLMAIAHQESNYRPDAIGVPTQWGRAKGLMQYIDPTAEGMGINPLDPAQSLDAAARQLSERLAKGYSMEEAVMAHFGGDDRSLWGPKTRRYGREVLAKAGAIYEQAAPREPAQPDNLRAFGESGVPSKPKSQTPIQNGQPDAFTGAARPSEQQQPEERQREQPMGAGQRLRQGMRDNEPEQTEQPAQQQIDGFSGAAIQADPAEVAARNEAATRGKATVLTDFGNLLQIGADRGVLSFREGVRQVFGDKVVGAIDRVDEWMNGEAPEDMFERQIDTNEGQLSQEMFDARRKDWVSEGDDGYSFGPAWGDWRSYAAGMVESLPETAVTMVPGAVLAKGVYANGIARGLSTAEAGRAAATTATIAGGLAEGFLGGGASAREVKTAIEGMTEEQLKDSEALQVMQAGGMSFEEARAQLADDSSTKAFVLAGTLTGAFGGMGDRALAKILTEGSTNRFTAGVRGAVSEGLLEELPQEGAQQASENYVMQDADPSIEVSDNVANAAVGGAVAGAGMGAGMGAALGGKRNTPADIMARELNRSIDAASAEGVEGEALRSMEPAPLEQEANGTPGESISYPREQWEADWTDFDLENPGATLNGAVGDLGMPAPGGAIESAMQESEQAERVAATQGERVVVRTRTGEISGTVQSYQEDGSGAFKARILGDDGSPYVFNESDDVKIVREDAATAAPRPPLPEEPQREQAAPGSVSDTADTDSTDIAEGSPEPMVQEIAPPTSSRIQDLSDEELQAQRQYVARQARQSGWSTPLNKRRKEIKAEIERREAAAAASQPPEAEEPAPVEQEALPAQEPGTPTNEPIVEHVTGRGKTLRGVVRQVTQDEAKAIDPYTFKKDGGWFIREKRLAEAGETASVQADVPRESLMLTNANKPFKTYEQAQRKINNRGLSGKPVQTEGGWGIQLDATVDIERASTPASPREDNYLGVNRDDKPLYEDENGARYYVEEVGQSKFKIQEPVGVTPTGAEIKTEKRPNSEFETTGEIAARESRAQPSKPKAAPTVAQFTLTQINPQLAEAVREDMENHVGEDVTDRDVNVEARNVLTGRPPDWLQDETADAIRAAAAQETAATPEPETKASTNTIFTEDAAEKARAILKAKLGQLNTGIDPEIMQAGITLAGYHIEKGARSFAAYASAMTGDLGDVVKPYLKSWYAGVYFDPRAEGFIGMSDPGEIAGMDIDAILAETSSNDTTVSEEPSSERQTDAPRSGEDQSGGDSAASEREPGRDTQQGASPADSDRVEDAPADNVAEPATTGDRPGVRRGAAAANVGGARASNRQRNASDRSDADSGAGTPDAGAGGERDRVTPVRAPESISPANPGPGNFYYDNPLDVVGGGQVARFNKNQAAIETYLTLRDEDREATREEQETLAGYTGWGSFGQELFQGNWERPQPKAGWEARDRWLRDHLGESEWKGMQRSIINAHYTDPPTTMAMWSMMERMGFKGGRVLEPSMGIGNFFGMMPRHLASRSQLTGIELDPITGGMAQKLYPDAGIRVMGYQDSKTPDDYYDVVIGNWPFENSPLADRRYNKFNPMVHDYFFLKALDQVRPGGIVMAITSAGSMDKKDARIRRELAKKGELIAAYRLPSGAFKEYAGTSVVTDILVLRKRAERLENVGDEGWIQSEPMKTKAGTDVSVNEYFHKHPENVIGEIDFGTGSTYGRPSMIVHRPRDMQAQLDRVVAEVPEGTYRESTRADHINYVTNHTDDREGSLTRTKDGLHVVRGEQLAPAEEVAKYKVKDAKATAEREAQLDALIGMRKQYAELIEAERSVDGNPDPVRKKLKKAYDAYVKANGPLNGSFGIKYLDKIKDPFAPSLRALERKEGKTWKPATILERSTIRTPKRIDNPSIEEAYVLARNGAVNPSPSEIAERSNTPEETVRQTLLDSGAIFSTPGGDIVPSDVYLSGNVRQKLRDAENALAEGVPDMQRNVDALKAALPADIPYFNIEVQMGASWVPTGVYEEFVAHMLDRPSTEGISVRYDVGRWKVRLSSALVNREEARTGYGTKAYNFTKLVNAAISNQTVTIKKTIDMDGSKTEVLDREATDETNNKISEMREKFGEWLWSDADRRDAMETEYNEVRNSYASPRYDGSFLRFEGMALEIGTSPFNLRQHQADAVWRALVTRKSLNAHEVGTGKSFTLAGIAVESRRYGIAKKPLVFAHNANSASVAGDINVMYPAAKVLYLDNLTPKEIDTRLRQIANDDWDAIVVPHSLIDRFSFKEDTLMAMAQEDIEALEREAYEAAQEEGGDLKPEMFDDEAALKKLRSPTAKNLVKQRNRIIETIKKQAQRSSRENAVTFEDLGVDMVLVDEVHEFKKPPITTKMRVKGLQTDTSQRSLQLRFITDYIRANNNGANVHTFTGTPITNTLTEIFHQMRYIMKEDMEATGVDQWDGWFGSFAKEVQDVELNGAGDWETVNRLRGFINVPELRKLVGMYMDVVFSDDMPEMQPRKTSTGKTLDDPSLTERERAELLNGRTEGATDRPYKQVITDTADLTEDQKAIFRLAQERSQDWKNMSGKERKEASNNGRPEAPIQVEGLVAKASFDARLARDEELAGMEGQVPDEPDSKLSRAIAKIVDIYNSDPNANQVVFSNSGLGKSTSRSVRDEAGNVVRDEDGKVKKRTVKVFSSMHDMIERLVQNGIPREQIALVDGSTNKAKRKEIAEAMNRSEIRVVIGSTQSLGVGVNMQRNLRAMHHMDAPYMPGDLEQRNGRGKRQANQWNTVQEHRYITDRLDGRRWQILSIKQQFIEDFLKADGSQRVIEGDAAEEEQSDILETFAEAAGDPRILIRTKLESQRDQLRKRQRLHEQGIKDAKRSQAAAVEQRNRHQDTLDRWEKDGVLEAARSAIKGNTGKSFSMTIDGTAYNDRKEADEAMQQFTSQELVTGSDAVALGEYGGIPVKALWDRFSTRPSLVMDVNGETVETGVDSIASLESTLRNLPDRKANLEERVTELDRSIERLGEVQQQPFSRAEKLKSTERQLDALEADLADNPVPPPAWLRQGAPIDTDVKWRGNDYTVTGHRWNEAGWFVLSEGAKGQEVQLPYAEVVDSQGMPLYEAREFEAPVLASDIPMDILRSHKPGMRMVADDPVTGEEVAVEITRAPFREGGKDSPVQVMARFPNGETRQIPVSSGEEVSKTLTSESGRQSTAELSERLRGNRLVGRMLDQGRVQLHATAAATGRQLPGTTAGFVDRNGKIHLIAGNIAPGNEIPVLMHEVFHNAVQPLAGSAQWSRLENDLRGLRSRARRARGKFREIYREAQARVEMAKAAGDTMTPSRELEEFGAYAIEQYERMPKTLRTWVDNAIGAMKAWMRDKLGVQLGQVSPAQLRAMAVAGMRSRRTLGGNSDIRYSLSPNDIAQRLGGLSKEDATQYFRNFLTNEIDYLQQEVRGLEKDLANASDNFAVRRQLKESRDALADYEQAANFLVGKFGNGILPLEQEGGVTESPEVTSSRDRINRAAESVDMAMLRDEIEMRQEEGSFSEQQTIDDVAEQIDYGAQDGEPMSEMEEQLIAAKARNIVRQALNSLNPSGSSDPDIRLSVADDSTPAQRKAALDAALAEMDGKSAAPPSVGRVIGDMSRIAKFFAHPRTIASLHKSFQPVYQTGINQFEMRDAIIDDLYQNYRTYSRLNQAKKAKVNKVLELGRLMGTTWDNAELQAGVTKPETHAVAKFTPDGKPYIDHEPLIAELTKDNETVTLTEEEADAYQALRAMFDNALDMFRDQTLDDYKLSEFKGVKNSAGAIWDTINDDMSAAEAERRKNIARFINEIEQAKRTGYVPFTRYGDYVVTVKEKLAKLDIIKASDPKAGWIVRDVPEKLEKFLAEVGAPYDNLEGAWRLDRPTKQALEKENERTVYSTKVETGLRDMWKQHKAMKAEQREDGKGAKLDNIPAVKDTIEKLQREWVADNPLRQVRAFPTAKISGGNPVSLTDLDALAEISSIDNETWDAVRDQLADTIKGLSFRKHFFQAQNVPGYSADFERSITDYMGGMGGYLSRRHHQQQWDDSVEKIKGERLREYAEKYRAYANSPQEEYAMLRQVGFLSYIAGNLATAFVNTTQVPVMTMPALSMVAGNVRAAKEVAVAYKDALKMYGLPNKTGLQMFDPSKAPADVRAALTEAWGKGAFVPLETFEVMAASRIRHAGQRRARRGFENLVQYTAYAFTAAERLNRLVTFIASARLARNPKVEAKARRVLAGNYHARQTVLNDWTPENFAEYIIDETQYRMGKANRPTVMRNVGAPIMQFKSFMFQTLETWYRWSTMQGKEGKMSAAASIAMMVGLGGLWGFPGAEDARDLIEKLWGKITKEDIDLEAELRVWIFNKTGQRWISEGVTKGLSYPAGLDLSRVGMGQIMPQGVDGVFGIPYDMFVGRPSRAMTDITNENYPAAAAEFVPNAIRNVIQAAQWSTDGAYDSKGRKLLDKENISTTAKLQRAVGFQPAVISQVRDYEWAQYRDESRIYRLKRLYTDRLGRRIADMVRAEQKGDAERARELEQDIVGIYEEIEQHNMTAAPEDIIEVGQEAVNNRVAREFGGVTTTWGREGRRAARGSAARLREVYGIDELIGEDD